MGFYCAIVSLGLSFVLYTPPSTVTRKKEMDFLVCNPLRTILPLCRLLVGHPRKDVGVLRAFTSTHVDTSEEIQEFIVYMGDKKHHDPELLILTRSLLYTWGIRNITIPSFLY